MYYFAVRFLRTRNIKEKRAFGLTVFTDIADDTAFRMKESEFADVKFSVNFLAIMCAQCFWA